MASKAQTVGQAGRCGKDARSDCRVTIEGRTSGGLTIELQSRVESYYGDAIRSQLKRDLAELGVEHARVVVEDEGALPFVLSARTEAAARRAGFGADRSVLPGRLPLPPASERDCLRRSRLYLPGSEPRYFVNAALHAPDAIILDLEDSVHADEKDAARILVRNTLRAVSFGACERMVRINQLPLGLADLEEVIPEEPDLILVPKVETAEQIREVERCIRHVQARLGLTRPVWLMPILESALGIENAFAIAHASELNVALTIGLEDYTADLGVPKTKTGEESFYARTRLVNAARAAGLQAIDSVFGDVGDMEGLRQWGARARALGFEGMGCIHPMQVRAIHDAFAPSTAEIEKALKVVAAFDDATARGVGVVSLGSKMIDAPVVHRARKLVERARQMGLVPQRSVAQEAGQ